MKIPTALIPACVLGLFAVLSSSSTALAAGIDLSAADLAKTDEAWSSAAGQRAVDLITSFYAEDAMIFSDREPLSTGREAARKFWVDSFADPSFSVTWKVANASVAKSGEMGYTTGSYQATFKGPDGKPASDKGKYVTIWKKGADGRWLVTHDIFNSDSK